MLNKHSICPQHLEKVLHLTWRPAHQIPFVGWHSGGGHPAILWWGKVKLSPFTSGSGKLSSGNLTYSLLWPPCSWRSAKPGKERQKTLFWEGERHWSCLGSPWWGLPCQVWDLTVSPLCPSVYHLLCSAGRIQFFCKTQSCETSEIKSMQWDPLASFFTKLSK